MATCAEYLHAISRQGDTLLPVVAALLKLEVCVAMHVHVKTSSTPDPALAAFYSIDGQSVHMNGFQLAFLGLSAGLPQMLPEILQSALSFVCISSPGCNRALREHRCCNPEVQHRRGSARAPGRATHSTRCRQRGS